MDRATLGVTIDELARRTGLTTRTIRAHQTAGLLPAPRLRGRTAYYQEHHAERLAAITRLQTRGWSRAAIGQALDAWDAGRTLADLLGLPPPGAPADAFGVKNRWVTPVADAKAVPASDWADELFATYVAPTEPGAFLPSPLSN
jgi:DNA-binding transcriptional MerR regulator